MGKKGYVDLCVKLENDLERGGGRTEAYEHRVNLTENWGLLIRSCPIIAIAKLCFVDPICRLFEPTHCLAPCAGSGMPFEKYGTDASGVGYTGSNCRPTEGVIKPRNRGEEGVGK